MRGIVIVLGMVWGGCGGGTDPGPEEAPEEYAGTYLCEALSPDLSEELREVIGEIEDCLERVRCQDASVEDPMVNGVTCEARRPSYHRAEFCEADPVRAEAAYCELATYYMDVRSETEAGRHCAIVGYDLFCDGAN